MNASHIYFHIKFSSLAEDSYTFMGSRQSKKNPYSLESFIGGHSSIKTNEKEEELDPLVARGFKTSIYNSKGLQLYQMKLLHPF